MRWAAMLRGINLGRRQLSKGAMIAAAEACGFADARTLLASGNLVFEAGDRTPAEIEAALFAAVEAQAGVRSDVFARNAGDFAGVIAANPFAQVARARPHQLVVHFHRAPVPEAWMAAFAGAHDGPERLAAVGRELFVDYPEGQGMSKLDQAMRRHRFPLVGTARNWNTVCKLAVLTAA